MVNETVHVMNGCSYTHTDFYEHVLVLVLKNLMQSGDASFSTLRHDRDVGSSRAGRAVALPMISKVSHFIV